MSRRTPCRFYGKPGRGCLKGASCPFLHADAPSGQPSEATQAQASLRGSQSSSFPAPNRDSPAPPGVCTFFWQRGDCTRGFQCRARHDLNPALAPEAPRTGATVASSIPAELAPFLTDAGLARMNDLSVDVLFNSSTKPKTPVEVHNFLKRFLYDNYRFLNALDVYPLVGLLTDASSNNSSWNTEDGTVSVDTYYNQFAVSLIIVTYSYSSMPWLR